jgi:hypothetical protein
MPITEKASSHAVAAPDASTHSILTFAIVLTPDSAALANTSAMRRSATFPIVPSSSSRFASAEARLASAATRFSPAALFAASTSACVGGGDDDASSVFDELLEGHAAACTEDKHLSTNQSQCVVD